MNKREFNGNTVITYQDFELGVDYPKRYFSNEVGVVTKEAYERDSSYWSKLRPKPLTEEEQRIIAIKDSVYAVQTSERYRYRSLVCTAYTLSFMAIMRCSSSVSGFGRSFDQ